MTVKLKSSGNGSVVIFQNQRIGHVRNEGKLWVASDHLGKKQRFASRRLGTEWIVTQWKNRK